MRDIKISYGWFKKHIFTIKKISRYIKNKTNLCKYFLIYSILQRFKKIAVEYNKSQTRQKNGREFIDIFLNLSKGEKKFREGLQICFVFLGSSECVFNLNIKLLKIAIIKWYLLEKSILKYKKIQRKKNILLTDYILYKKLNTKEVIKQIKVVEKKKVEKSIKDHIHKIPMHISLVRKICLDIYNNSELIGRKLFKRLPIEFHIFKTSSKAVLSTKIWFLVPKILKRAIKILCKILFVTSVNAEMKYGKMLYLMFINSRRTKKIFMEKIKILNTYTTSSLKLL